MRTKDSSDSRKSPITQLPTPMVVMKPRAIGDVRLRDKIARRAHAMYVDQGRPHGQDVQHWLEAEAQVIKSHKDAGRGIEL